MTVEANIHAALIAQAETMATALSYTVLWPQKGGDTPSGEHLRINHLPNDNFPADLSSQVYERQGFLFITLVSPLGVYEATTKQKAGQIVAYFPRGKVLTSDGDSVKITGHSVGGGRQEGVMWETPIQISYWSMT
jgi:hypothetical protein